MADIISKEEVKYLIESENEIILLDVRDTPDYQQEHITGAVHMLISDLDTKSGLLLRKDVAIITYSEDFDCPASTIAAEKLQNMGYGSVMDYKGSFKEWKDAGYPTEL